jgi:peptide deformylase
MKLSLTTSLLDKKCELVTNFKECYLEGLKVKEWLKNKKAYAIAFNQLGINKACVVFNRPNKLGIRDSIIFNPSYSSLPESDIIESEEGCLSYPGKKFKVNRLSKIKVEYFVFGLNNQVKKIIDVLDREGCIAYQHETDHINGIIDMYKGENDE